MPNKEKKTGDCENKIVVFKIAGEEFGADISKVKEIIRFASITPIPNVEDSIKGIINLRGRIVVLLSLAKKLNLAEKGFDKDTRVIIIESDSKIVGLIVDSVEEVLKVLAGQISSAPEMIKKSLSQDYIEGVCTLGERLVILLDLPKMLSAAELNNIKELNKA